tara:strand:+ start:95 stop:1156 length:1062 start_codon:yes stop_codon:yes gene_type:complete
MDVLIFGAGSIGNHLANASRNLEWNVTIFDIDPKALKRTKQEIYPGRYLKWDNSIKLIDNLEELKISPDLIIIGTPPDSHISLALKALDYQPKAILIEKPLCPPSKEGLEVLIDKSHISETKFFVGYNHVLGKASKTVDELIKKKNFGEIITIDVEFREHWGGIFSAHNWLKGPSDSYLGFYEKGGGATGEHSHAINLWQYFAKLTNFGEVNEVIATMQFNENDGCKYDEIAAINLISNKKLIGRVIQDVVTKPSRKWARIQFTKGFIEWECKSNINDSVLYQDSTMNTPITLNFPKSRPDDFIAELIHIKESIEGKISDNSPISLKRGYDTMSIISAAYQSGITKYPVKLPL